MDELRHLQLFQMQPGWAFSPLPPHEQCPLNELTLRNSGSQKRPLGPLEFQSPLERTYYCYSMGEKARKEV